jgi:hypothetical protein
MNHRVLHLSHALVAAERHAIEMTFADGESLAGQAAQEFEFDFTRQSLEDIRWYLEDYVERPVHPAPLGAGAYRTVFAAALRVNHLGKHVYSFPSHALGQDMHIRMIKTPASTTYCFRVNCYKGDAGVVG